MLQLRTRCPNRSTLCAVARVEPPRTCTEAASQARTAYRLFREHKQSGIYTKAVEKEPYRLTIELPLPVDNSLPNSARKDLVVALDESDWPGGIIQKFRALKPLVENVFEGYQAEFVGLIESAADGVGVWSMPDATAVANVTNATFPSMISLCTGKYGKKPLQADHTIVAMNPSWTSATDVGQPWDRDLKAQAKVLIDSPQWEVLYCCQLIRTGRGALGVVLRSYPHPWSLYALPTADCEVVGPCLLTSSSRPTTKLVVESLSASRDQVLEQFKDYLEQRRRQTPWWQQ